MNPYPVGRDRRARRVVSPARTARRSVPTGMMET